jgi:AcrR family transcriptional regulator
MKTPTVRRTQAQRKEISERTMFATATRLILERGTVRTTLKDVGEKSGYSRGLAQARFGNKEQLFHELIGLYGRTWSQELEHFVGDKTGLDALFSATEALEDFLESAPDQLRAMYILWFESVGAGAVLRKRLRAMHETSRADVKRWIDQAKEEGTVDPALDSSYFSDFYCSFVFGLIYQWLVSPNVFDLAGLLETVRGYLRAIIQASGTTGLAGTPGHRGDAQ